MSMGLLLSIIFMILKLTGYISWNWGIVFLPAIIEFALAITVRGTPFWWRDRSG